MRARSNSTRPAPSAERGETSPRLASVAFVVYGQCYSMKNGKDNHVKHPKCKAFERDFAYQVPVEAKVSMGSQESPLRAIVSVFYPSWRQDVDVEIVWDMLQTCGVVSNDRWIREKHVYGCAIDRERPRVEIHVEEI